MSGYDARRSIIDEAAAYNQLRYQVKPGRMMNGGPPSGDDGGGGCLSLILAVFLITFILSLAYGLLDRLYDVVVHLLH